MDDNFIQTESGTNITCSDGYSTPKLITANIFENRVEMVYRQEPRYTFTTTFDNSQPEPRIYKMIYKAKKGKLVYTETIYATYVPAREEFYYFEE